MLTSMVRSKSLALKNKTSALKTRLIIFSLLKNKKVLLSTISHKIHALMGQEEDNRQRNEDGGEQSKAIVLCNAMTTDSGPNPTHITEFVEESEYEEEEEDKYPDWTHSLFENEDEFGDSSGSVIDLVRNSKEEGGEEFKLEDEIDHVADLFIKRFHRQMMMQKQQSFKNYQEMLERSA